MRKHGKLILTLMCMALLVCSLSVTCFVAGTGDVSGALYFEYKKHGQFEFTPAAILFACLIFILTAPLYVWSIIGM